ncbi:pre-mRNA-splicing factor 38B-like [Mercenaria mercenaria]|uniref:pre-mRNA-splicing factor 38B-like n=1 Tax=Mercenaria mercenaria TaxID=6596 RepID=UPI001E1DDA75|nr:pre-mRNA-splicing factor 38B-like [Mercenaria mercenaria]
MAPNNVLPIWGNEKTMNLNPLILTNIQSSPYFKQNLYELKTYHEVIDEIYYKVTHLEPWEKGSRKTAGQTGMCGGVRGVGAGGIVSSAYCLLYKLFTLRLTRKQVKGLIDHSDSPYIRGLGFMYIRYTQDPKDLWDWFEPYLDDEEEVDVKAGGGHVIMIGEMVRQWLVKLEWYSTLFPRIPVPVQKDLDVKLKARMAEKLQQQREEAPRHIADDEVNFGEAEKYASHSSSRKRSPTPPHRSRARSPPPRRSPPRRSPRRSPVRHRSPPRRRSPYRHRYSPPRHRRSRSRSPKRSRPEGRGQSPIDYARELQKEKERQNRENERSRRSRSRSRDRKKRSRSRERSSKQRSRSQDRVERRRSRSRDKVSSKHRSRSRSRDRKKHKRRSRSLDRNGH